MINWKSSKEDIIREQIVTISQAITRASLSENDYFTINNIIRDLNEDKSLQECFLDNLKIDGSPWFESDSSLLDIPLSKLTDKVSFANKTMIDLIKSEQDQYQKEQEIEEELEEELESIKEQVKLNKFWDYDDLVDICDLNRPDIYHAAYAIYEEPYNFLKELAQSLCDELYNEGPNMAKLRSLADQISEFFSNERLN